MSFFCQRIEYFFGLWNLQTKSNVNMSRSCGFSFFVSIFKDFIYFEYSREKTESGNPQKTWIKAKNDVVFVFNNGIILDPTMVTLYGYLTREGIYQLLPFDYEANN